jgi:PIN domain nuclease of toxin-antitoxin system
MSRLLIDTHVLLWHYLDDPQLSGTARALLADPANTILVSPACHWEVAIKIGVKKYALNVPFLQFVRESIFDNGFHILPVEPEHTGVLSGLPLYHKDPFDRIQIAQAIHENIPLVSGDNAFDPYPVRRLW